ncbi:periphilin-1-like [Huso huso]|uniref:Periphilin-1-like n=1 Tax=Huso huso TaxID=61971 RepID=A0ABR0ZCT7_HUSHU
MCSVIVFVPLGKLPQLSSVAYRRDQRETWNDPQYFNERNQQRFPQAREGSYQRIVNVVPRNPMFDRPEENYREFMYEGNSRNFPGDNYGSDQRNCPPQRWEEQDRWQKEQCRGGRQAEFREDREQFRRKSFFPPHVRDRSPNRKGPAYYRNSPGGRRGSPHSRSGSSVSNKSFSPDKNKPSSYQAQHNKNKERPSTHSLNTLRDASPPSSTSLPTSKISLDKSSRPPECQTTEALSERPDDILEKSNEQDLSDTRKEYDEKIIFEDEPEEPHTSKDSRVLDDDFLDRRSQAIAEKAKEIEEVYRQDCETFGMVVKMLVNKDPTLEKQVQLSLRENLREIGERCIEEIKNFISEYDNAPAQPE